MFCATSPGSRNKDTERQNKKWKRAGQPPLEPLYTAQDVEAILGAFQTAPYQEQVPIAPGMKASFAEAGHMLGSASIRLMVEEEGREKKVVFSGDLGPISAPLLRRYEPFHAANLVFLESTYGNRDHRPFRGTVEEFKPGFPR